MRWIGIEPYGDIIPIGNSAALASMLGCAKTATQPTWLIFSTEGTEETEKIEGLKGG
jgi:hypothetical protein